MILNNILQNNHIINIIILFYFILFSIENWKNSITAKFPLITFAKPLPVPFSEGDPVKIKFSTLASNR